MNLAAKFFRGVAMSVIHGTSVDGKFEILLLMLFLMGGEVLGDGPDSEGSSTSGDGKFSFYTSPLSPLGFVRSLIFHFSTPVATCNLHED